MKKKLLASAITLQSALIAGVPANDALAQETRQTAASIMLEEVIITARKKDESMQDVPVAVSALNSEQFEALKIRTIDGVWRGMPNVNMLENGTIKGTANYAIRGVGVVSSIPAVDPVVGVFLDGIYLGQNNGLITDLYDVDSVQVLRGPQGTLWGKNVTGGAVLMNNKRPTMEFEAQARTAVDGNPNGDGGMNYYAMGLINGVLIDNLAGRLVGYYNKDDGWFENEFDGDDYGKNETQMWRPSMLWTPTEDIDLFVSYEYQDVDGDGAVAQSINIFPELPGLPFAVNDLDSHKVSNNNRGFDKRRLDNVVARLDWQVGFGDGTVTNLFGYRDLRSKTLIDYDSQPVDALIAYGLTDYDQWSNELRFVGTFGNWDVTTGLYYFTSTTKYTEGRVFFTLAPVPINMWGGGDQDMHNYSWFGEVEYSLGEKWKFSAGLNASRDDKSIKVSSITPTADNEPCDVRNGTCEYQFRDSYNNDEVSPKAVVSYFYSDDTMFYGQAARAFRSGLYSVRATWDISDPSAPPGPTDDEQTDSFELGFKTAIAGVARLNGAVFLNRTDDKAAIVQTSGPSGAIQTPLTIGDTEVWGVELDGSWSLTDSLLLTGSVGYMDNEYRSVATDLTGDGIVDNKDENLDLILTPEWTYRVGLLYDLDLGDWGNLSSRISYAYIDYQYEIEDNAIAIPDREMVDAGMDWYSLDGHWTVGIYGKNLTDEVYHGGVNPFPALPSGDNINPYWGGGAFAPLAKGRTLGLDVTYNF